MRKFVEFVVQYLIPDDPVPFTTKVTKAMEPEKALDYINYRNSIRSDVHYCPKEFRVLDEIDALKYVLLVIEEEQTMPLDDSEERINNLLSELKECYNIDYKPNN